MSPPAAVAIGLAAGLAAFSAVRPAAAEIMSFTILKGADPIGTVTYQVATQGDTTTVRVDTTTDVKVLFLSYHLRHTRTEVWRAGILQSFVSDTNDDGHRHHIDAKRQGDAVVAIADGVPKRLPGDAVPFTLWNRDLLLNKSLMFDVADFKPLNVEIEYRGRETVAVGHREVAVRHYHMVGDEHWDFWFDAGGSLVKTGFTRSGYHIYFVRD